MKAISLFSGVGGFEIGLERAGIQTVLQAESDPWCLEVLARQWRDVERVNDVRKVDQAALQGRCGDVVSVGVGSDAERMGDARGRRGNTAGVDLVYGGFPCQDVSVAGNRAGLGGARSGLWSEFRRVLSELRPQWCVIENVPGLLSICSCAACVLIASWQLEHNEQRRKAKRAGSCGCPECRQGQELRASHTGRDFGHILLELEELGFGWAYGILDARFFGVPQRRRRVFIVGCLGNPDAAAAVLAVCESCGGHPAPSRETWQGIAPGADDGVAFTLPSEHRGIGNGWNTNHVVEPEARALTARASGYRMDGETENFIVAGAQSASDGHHGHSSPRGDGADNLIAFSNRGHHTDGAETLRAVSHGALPMAGGTGGVRRLTPLECERLMAFPDDHTRWTSDGQEIPDSHRYRMCGNGVVATCAEWIGWRLMHVDRMLRSAAA